MEGLKNLSLIELKSYKDLLENRMDEFRRHQIDDDYYPPYTDKEIQELKELEKKAAKALSTVNKLIRSNLDKFINDLEL